MIINSNEKDLQVSLFKVHVEVGRAGTVGLVGMKVVGSDMTDSWVCSLTLKVPVFDKKHRDISLSNTFCFVHCICFCTGSSTQKPLA